MRIVRECLHMSAMNQLNVNLQHSILTLAGNGWSHRRIARELDINRETVGKYLLLAQSKPAISTIGPTAGWQSLCQPWRPQIEAAVAVGLSAQSGQRCGRKRADTWCEERVQVSAR